MQCGACSEWIDESEFNFDSGNCEGCQELIKEEEQDDMETAEAVIDAIIAGKIPHVSINY